MSRFLILALAGAGGDLPPLISAALALHARGHQTSFIGDSGVKRALTGVEVDVSVLPTHFDIGPVLAGAIRNAMTETGGDLTKAGPIVEARLGAWAEGVAKPVSDAITDSRPDVVVTSLFGVEVVRDARPTCPWAVVNSTFYVGPNPPRPVEQDIGPRAVPLIRRYGRLLEEAPMVLHATDQVFDYSFDRLPAGHHYVGPLGLWEPPANAPMYLDEPGDPWVLVSISSQLQDDLPLAESALQALGNQPVRVVLTVGPDHQVEEISRRPPNAHVEQVVPHSAVLKRGRLLVSHAGHGSVMKALWEGRPMVLVPWGRDQPGVAARAEALGVAEVVDRNEHAEASLSAAVERVLVSDQMRETAALHASRLQATDPPGAAADLLESLAR